MTSYSGTSGSETEVASEEMGGTELSLSQSATDEEHFGVEQVTGTTPSSVVGEDTTVGEDPAPSAETRLTEPAATNSHELPTLVESTTVDTYNVKFRGMYDCPEPAATNFHELPTLVESTTVDTYNVKFRGMYDCPEPAPTALQKEAEEPNIEPNSHELLMESPAVETYKVKFHSVYNCPDPPTPSDGSGLSSDTAPAVLQVVGEEPDIGPNSHEPPTPAESTTVDIYNVKFHSMYNCPEDPPSPSDSRDLRDGETAPTALQTEAGQPDVNCDIFNVKFCGIH